MKPRLIDELVQEPGRFEFVELVRRLEHALTADVRAPAGEPTAARIAFAHSPDLTFPVGTSHRSAWIAESPASARPFSAFSARPRR
jgi:predicted component of type VI protein secretion system